MATLGSVGIGSGVLTSDILEQLKENDKITQINPIDRSIETNSQKSEALDLLESLTSALKGSASSLKDSSLYLKRTVSGANDEIEVTAKDGVGIQDFSIKDVKLANTSIVQSDSFSSEDSKIASGDGTLNIRIDDTDFEIAYDSNTSFGDLRTKINDLAGDKVSASILQTGDDSYSFIITSDVTGKDQEINLIDLSGKLNDELKSDTLTSGNFTAADDKIAGAGTSGILTLSVGDNDFEISYDENTTLEDLAQMINDSDFTSSKTVFASVVDDGSGNFTLQLSAVNGSDNKAISITDSADGGLDAKLTDPTSVDGAMTEIQTATDASFKYNGISITRSSNTIDDIQLGLEIKLLKDDASANISITQDTQPIKDALETFVTGYNTMQEQLDAMTLADLEENKVGIFNGDNSINAIGRSIRNLLTSRDSNTNQGLAQYGVELDRTGKLNFNSSMFDDMMKKDSDGVADFFSGKTTVDSASLSTSDEAGGNIIHKDGIFEKLYNNLRDLSLAGGTISSIGDGLSREGKQLEDNRVKALDMLNSRYDTMTARFIQYDAMINRLNNSFSALQLQISMATNES